jgi:16S rRNA (guanine527-N7)-methyltransferase
VLARLDHYLALLAVWNRTTRLTGERDVGAIVRKHVIDSLAPAAYLSSRGPLADVGSGAGFPGIILACLRPEAPVVLIEARRRRASFLREVVRTLGLPAATVLEGRAEAVRVSAATVIARALRIDVFLPLAARLVAPGGQVLAMQTARADPARVASTGRAAGLVLADVHDYVLPGGERRRLLRFAAGGGFSHPPAVC